MSSSKSSKSTKASNTPHFLHSLAKLSADQKIALTSIIIIVISLALAFSFIHLSKTAKAQDPRFNQDFFQLSLNLPPAQIYQPYSGSVTVTSIDTQSQLFLSLSQLPPGLRANCSISLQPTNSDTCHILGTPTESGNTLILATMLDKVDSNQFQQWLPLRIRSNTIEDSFRSFFSI